MWGGPDGLATGRAPLRPGPGRRYARGPGSPRVRRREPGAAAGAPRRGRLGRGTARGCPRERAQPQVRLAPDELIPVGRREGLGYQRGRPLLDVPAAAQRVLAVGARITDRRAASAARQLLYHRERLGWMEERMGENAALLESFLALAGEDETVLPGGYVLVREGGSGTPLEVRRISAGGGFEQLRIDVG